MLRLIYVRLALVLFALSVCGSAFAEFWVPVRQQSYDGVPYVTGGIGSTEQEYLKSKELRAQYNLEILTAAKSGSYVSMARVVIHSAGRVVLQAKMDGPMLLALLPNGKYRVEVSVGSETQSRHVSVKQGSLRRVITSWDVTAERLDEPEISPAHVHPVVPQTIDGIEVTTVPGFQGETGSAETFSERQRRLEKARQLREQALRLEEEARLLEQAAD